MNEPPTTPSPLQPNPPPRRSSSGKIILIVVVVGGLLLCTCVGGFVWFILAGKAEVEPVATAFLDALAAEDYAKAYGFVGPEWKQIDDADRFTQIEQRFVALLGTPTSRSLRSFNISRNAGVPGEAVMIYDIDFAQGSAAVTLTLSDTSGAWQVINHRIDSPLLVQAQTCPKCGAQNATMGKFCSQCGAELPLSGATAP